MKFENLKAVCFANFSGKSGERASIEPMELTPNTWETLWEHYRPRVQMMVDLPGAPSLSVTIELKTLKDFNPKGLSRSIPLLGVLQELKDAIGSSNAENPLQQTVAVFSRPEIGIIRAVCGKPRDEGQVVDLLSMVDIGDDEEESMSLNNLLTVLNTPVYYGEKREKALFDISKIEAEVHKQVMKNTTFQQVHAAWQTLKFWSKKSNAMKLDVVDCDASELCDAFYLNYVKPESGDARPLDLAFTLYDFDASEKDRNTLYYLGKMAESISVPLLGNASPRLFGVKTEKRIGHIQDYTGKFASPEYAKWRKLRDEPGSNWIFLFVNSFTLSNEEPVIWIPGSAWGASLIRFLVTAETWPGELLGPIGRMEYGEEVALNLSDAQLNDLGYNGFCAINRDGVALHMAAMMGLGSLKIPSHAQSNASALVPFTLAFRFASGLFARAYLGGRSSGNVIESLKTHFNLKDNDLLMEEGDNGPIIRISAPLGVFGIRPEFLLG